MKTIILLLFILLNISAIAQNQHRDIKNEDDKWSIQYDLEVLRVPENDFRIGISEKKADGNFNQTRGFLKGKVKWNKFRIEVEGATFRNGKIKIPETNNYLKDTAITVNVYRAKSSTLLFAQSIPYHYETGVKFLTNGEMGKVPGSIVKYGFRIYFNNGTFEDFYPAKAKRRFNIFRIDSTEIIQRTKLEEPLDQFLISSDGGYFLKRYLVIETDPFNIKYHTAQFVVSLAKSPNISDTLKTELDYIENYTFDSRFVRNYCLSANSDNEDYSNNSITYSSAYYGDEGHNLEVYAELYQDTFFKDSLLLVVVTDINNCEHYNYLVNTNGGTIKIFSHGLQGSDGSDGRTGTDGSNGTDGLMGSSGSTYTTHVTNSDGSVTVKTETGPGGNGGNGSNGSDGERGGDGSDGSNGGNGGDIYFTYTRDVIPYLHLIDIRSIPGEGGKGGSGGRGGSGGSGGKGGSGGYGNPSGSAGSIGNNGSNGSRGHDGSDGNKGNKGVIVKKLVK